MSGATSPPNAVIAGEPWPPVTAYLASSHAPGFFVAAVITLALGITAATLVFVVVDPVVVQPPPYPNSQGLLVVGQQFVNRGAPVPMAPEEFLALRDRQDVFQAFAGSGRSLRLDAGDRHVTALGVTTNLFDTLDARPVLGRNFTAGDADAPARVAIISYPFWQHLLGGSPAAVGRVLASESGPVQTVGVMPAEFVYPAYDSSNAWFPWVPRDNERHLAGADRGFFLSAIGRVRPGVKLAAVRGRLEQIGASILQDEPSFHRGWTLSVQTLADSLAGPSKPWLVMLLSAVGLLLLIATANVASLMLVRVSGREKELAIRTALGATRARLMRSLLLESAVVALAAASASVLAASWMLGVVRHALPRGIPSASGMVMGLRVWLAVAVTTGGATMLIALMSSWQASRANVARGLTAGRTRTVSRSGRRSQSLLAAAEVALATTLLVTTGLIVSSFVRVTGMDLGIDCGPQAIRASSRRPSRPRSRAYSRRAPRRGCWRRTIAT